MLDDKKDDVFLSRWLNGELSEVELREFKSHPEYDHYIKIIAGADALDLKSYAIDKELSALKSKREYSTKKESKPIIRLWPYFAVAASLAILIGIFLFNKNESFSANFGEQLAVALPDGSEMILNAKSTANFDKDNWSNTRTVSLEGEAYFKVKKGSTFTVLTKSGEVSVLGTQFNVQSQNKYFEVRCFEGKVKVINNANKEVLTAGKGYRNIENTTKETWDFDAQKPSWLTYTSSFRSVPIKYVFNELEEQYNIQIKTIDIDLDAIYTGTFPNRNKEVALKTVFSTLGIAYSVSQDGKTVVLE